METFVSRDHVCEASSVLNVNTYSYGGLFKYKCIYRCIFNFCRPIVYKCIILSPENKMIVISHIDAKPKGLPFSPAHLAKALDEVVQCIK